MPGLAPNDFDFVGPIPEYDINSNYTGNPYITYIGRVVLAYTTGDKDITLYKFYLYKVLPDIVRRKLIRASKG